MVQNDVQFFMSIAMSKIRALHPIKINLKPNYANLVIKSNKIIYKLCIIAVVMGIIGKFLSIVQKHNR